MTLIVISPLLLFAIFRHGGKNNKQDELTKELNFYLEKNVTTGIKAILQRDSLDKISNLSSHVALMGRFKETQNELLKQEKQLNGLRRIVMNGK